MLFERNPALDAAADMIAESVKPDELITHESFNRFARESGYGPINDVHKFVTALDARLRARNIVLHSERGVGWRYLIAGHVLVERRRVRRRRILGQISRLLKELAAIDGRELTAAELSAVSKEQCDMAAIKAMTRKPR